MITISVSPPPSSGTTAYKEGMSSRILIVMVEVV